MLFIILIGTVLRAVLGFRCHNKPMKRRKEQNKQQKKMYVKIYDPLYYIIVHVFFPPPLPTVYYTATAIPFIFSFSGNCAASAPISTFMCLWAIYMFPGLVHIFPPAEKADPSREYIICSQTHECGHWDWDSDIPFLGIFVSNFRHFVLQCITNITIDRGLSFLFLKSKYSEIGILISRD